MTRLLTNLFEMYLDAARENAQHDPLRPGAGDRI